MRVTCRLRQIRGDASLTEYANRCVLSKGTLSRIERGIQFPTDQEWQEIREVYGVLVPADVWPEHVAIELHADTAEAAA